MISMIAMMLCLSGGESPKPKEFRVDPSSGVLEPKSDVTFTVSLCPNSVAQYFREVAVSFDEVSNETYTVPITAQYAHTPRISFLFLRR